MKLSCLFNSRIAALQMAVHIAFEKSADTFIKKVVKTFAGPYVHTELIVSDDGNTRTAYSAYMSENFSRTFEKDFCFDDERFDFLCLPVSPEELILISKTCEACVDSKIPYNTQDMVLSQMPFRNPSESDIFHSSTLFCSQAIVLVLRSCLNPKHAALNHLASVNSRTVSPSAMYHALLPCCTPKTKSQALR